MKKMVKPGIVLFMLSLWMVLIPACSTNTTSENKEAEPQPETNAAIENDTTPGVTGIGGIFFYAQQPRELSGWYGKNLGLAIDEYGSPFEFRNANRPEEINYLRWSPVKEGSAFFDPSESEFMINYRVRNIEGLVRKLKLSGVTILDTIAEYPYGKFVHILDPEGNKIELWEPIDSFFTETGGETTK